VEFRLRPLLVLHIHRDNVLMGVPTSEPGGETTKSIRDMWWHWGRYYLQKNWKYVKLIVNALYSVSL
jgi:hypothetical protein